YLPFVAEKIAEVKELPLDTVISQTYTNSLRTFFPNE
ncbi:MAG: TatD family deoxyribonuclease, partial [Pseudomonadota bacterium]|nr:TatD family deoxyribonuclease [Pseudomonadota bacterium]